MAPGEFYKYLSVHMGTGGGATAFRAHEDLVRRLGRLLKAPALPQQKLWDLTNIVIPQILYPLVNLASTAG